MRRYPILLAVFMVFALLFASCSQDMPTTQNEVYSMALKITKADDRSLSTDSVYTDAQEVVSYQYRAVCVTSSGAHGSATSWTSLSPSINGDIVSATLPELARGTWDIHIRAKNANGGVILQGSALSVVLSRDNQAVSVILKSSVSDYSVASPANVQVSIGVSVPTQADQSVVVRYVPVESIADLNTAGTGGNAVSMSSVADRITSISGTTVVYNTVRSGWSAYYGTISVQPGYYVIQAICKVDGTAVSGEVFALLVEENSPFAVSGTLSDGEFINMDLSSIAAGSAALDILNADSIGERFEGFSGTSRVYSPSATYAVGEYVIHENTLYMCLTPVDTPEAFDVTKWRAIDLTTLNERFDDLMGDGDSEVYDDYYGGSSIPYDAQGYGELKGIYGQSIVWNQQIKNIDDSSNFDYSSYASILSNDLDGNLTVTSGNDNYDGISVLSATNVVQGHKYYWHSKIKASVASLGYVCRINDNTIGSIRSTPNTADTYCEDSFIFTAGVNGSNFRIESGSKNITVTISGWNVYDLTLMFGPGNEPTTVAEALQRMPALGQYNEYNPGEIISTEIGGLKSVGVNIFPYDVVRTYNYSSDYKSYNADNAFKLKAGTYYALASSSASKYLQFFNDEHEQYVVADIVTYVSHGSGAWDGLARAFYTAVTFTISRDCIVTVCVNNPPSDETLQICLDSYADKTTYHPYVEDSITFEEAIILRSAGNVHDTFDPETGIITRRVGVYTFTGNESVAPWSGSYTHLFRVTADVGQKTTNQRNLLMVGYIPFAETAGDFQENCVYTSYDTNTFAINDMSCTTVAQLLANITGKTILYELAEPTYEYYTPVDPYIEVTQGGTTSLIHCEAYYTQSSYEMSWPSDASAVSGSQDSQISAIQGFTDEYSPKKTYAVGDYAILSGSLYRCISAVTTPERFNASKWERVDLTTLDSNLTRLLMKPVGGTIFYVHSDNGAKYTFYDASYNRLITDDSDVSTFEDAVWYTVEGTPTADKYYVWNPDAVVKAGGTGSYTSPFVAWTYLDEANATWTSGGADYSNGNYTLDGYAGRVYESISVTANGIGKGKTNTEAMMSIRRDVTLNGQTDKTKAYIQGRAIRWKNGGTYSETIWYVCDQFNRDTYWRFDNNTGCDDWFVPSIDELSQFRAYCGSPEMFVTKTSTNGSYSYAWSSSAYADIRRAYYYDVNLSSGSDSVGAHYRYGGDDSRSLVLARAF